MAKIQSIEKLEENTEGLCIEVDTHDKLFAAGGDDGKSIVTHNSVVQRNIVVSCIMRSTLAALSGDPNDGWAFIGIDLKRVELSAYRKYSHAVIGIATDLEAAVVCLRFGVNTMMKRYESMEQLGYNNYRDLPNPGRRLLIMIDEAAELFESSSGGTKALVASTPVLMADGTYKPIGELQIGDKLLDPLFNVCEMSDKYIPDSQDRYDLTFAHDDRQESFVAGAEHYWPVYLFSAASGEQITDELKLTTEELAELTEKNKHVPKNERVVIKLRRRAQ